MEAAWLLLLAVVLVGNCVVTGQILCLPPFHPALWPRPASPGARLLLLSTAVRTANG